MPQEDAMRTPSAILVWVDLIVFCQPRRVRIHLTSRMIHLTSSAYNQHHKKSHLFVYSKHFSPDPINSSSESSCFRNTSRVAPLARGEGTRLEDRGDIIKFRALALPFNLTQSLDVVRLFDCLSCLSPAIQWCVISQWCFLVDFWSSSLSSFGFLKQTFYYCWTHSFEGWS